MVVAEREVTAEVVATEDAADAAAPAPEAEAMDLMLEVADVGTMRPVLPPGQTGQEM